MAKILFATTNRNKIEETLEILGVEIEPIWLNIDEVQTLDPIECVEKKAEVAYSLVGKPVLVEDTSLFFDAWNGLPGVFIDYFMKSVGNEGIFKMLGRGSNRNAKAQTSVCYYDGISKVSAVGIVRGEISKEIRGDYGFGWDPIFIPQGFTKTFAELGGDIKNNVSMRKIALEKLRKRLKFI